MLIYFLLKEKFKIKNMKFHPRITPKLNKISKIIEKTKSKFN